MAMAEQEKNLLVALGERLQQERLKRNEPQILFAARIGTSVPTLAKMEAGNPRVQFGHWVAALAILGREQELDLLIAPKEDLFEKYEQSQKPKRRRASRKRH